MLEDERLSEIRPLWDEPFTLKTWRALTEFLEAWEDEDELEDELLPKLQPHLAQWEDHLRRPHPRWVERLLQGEYVPHMRAIRTLDLRCMAIDVEIAEVLSDSTELEQLTRLLLPYNGLQDDGTIRLAGASVLSQLKWLDLAGNSVATEGVVALAESAHMANLEHLDLTGNWVGDQAAKALSSSPHMANLQTLILRGNPIRQEGAKALARSEFLTDAIRSHWRDFEG